MEAGNYARMETCSHMPINKCFGLVFLALMAVGKCWCQEPPPGAEERLSWRIQASMLYLDDTEVGTGNGSYSLTKSQISLSYNQVTLDYSRWDFEWQDVGKLPFGDGINDPWKQFEKVSISANKIIPASGHDWSYLVGGAISSYFEDNVGDSLGTTVFGGVVFGKDRSSQFIVGAVYKYHKVHSILWPMVGYSFRTDSGWSVDLGFPRTGVSWSSGPLTLSAGFLADLAMVGLSEKSSVAPDGYLEAINVMVTAGVSYSFRKNLTLGFKLARSIDNEVTFYDSHEHELSDYDVEQAFGFQLDLSYRF